MSQPKNSQDLSANASREVRVESSEGLRWRNFCDNRTRPCPFFEAGPDENLVDWVENARIRPASVLDIGCGNGRNAVYLSSRGFLVQGIDLSAQAIAWAQERAAAASERIDLTCGSVFDNAPAPRSLDFAYDSGCFHHLAPHQRSQYAQLVTQALKPGGHFGLVCFAPEGGSGYTDEQVYELGSLGGGLGYSEEELRSFWSVHLEVVELRRMNEQPPTSGTFGKNFLWAMLARAGDA